MRNILQFFLVLYFILGLHGGAVVAADGSSSSSVSPQKVSHAPEEEEEDEEVDEEEDEEDEEAEKEQKGMSDNPQVRKVQQQIYRFKNNQQELLRYLLTELVPSLEAQTVGSIELKEKKIWFQKTMNHFPALVDVFNEFLVRDPISTFKNKLRNLLALAIPVQPSSIPLSSSPSALSSLPFAPSSWFSSSSASSSMIVGQEKDVKEFKIRGLDSDRVMTEQDPPFYRITAQGGREIYVLGSVHTARLGQVLHPNAIKVLQSLYERKAILYTEHVVTNEIALSALASHQAERKSFGDLLSKGVRQEFETKLGSQKILLSPGIVSDVLFSQILKAEEWLAMVILLTHANSLSYAKGDGMEHGLCSLSGWGAKKYLEEPEEAFALLQKNAEGDMEQNKMFAKHFLTRILSQKTTTEEELRELISENYKLDVVLKTLNNRAAIARNRLWLDKIVNELKGSSPLTPLLIVVGYSHLSGHRDRISLQAMLIDELAKISGEKPKVALFNNRRGWLS